MKGGWTLRTTGGHNGIIVIHWRQMSITERRGEWGPQCIWLWLFPMRASVTGMAHGHTSWVLDYGWMVYDRYMDAWWGLFCQRVWWGGGLLYVWKRGLVRWGAGGGNGRVAVSRHQTRSGRGVGPVHVIPTWRCVGVWIWTPVPLAFLLPHVSSSSSHFTFFIFFRP